MSLSSTNPSNLNRSNSQAWYRPTWSHEHGVYIILFISFFIGAAAARAWNLSTTLALICAFTAFQAEHPLTLQIKQRSSWKPRFLVWGSIYSIVALAIAVDLYWHCPILIWLYLGAISSFAIDAISVFYRQQKSLFNEILAFAGICLAAPLAFVATKGTLTVTVFALWLLNTLFFSSAIFTVKLRKPKSNSLIPGLIYHAIAASIVLGLWYGGLLASITASAFGVVLCKYLLILWQKEWYRTTQIQNVAILETTSALLFLVIAAVSLLPPHLV
jgi:hypothetical protein